MIRSYRHKPIEIKALQFDGENFDEIIDFIGNAQMYYIGYCRKKINRIGLVNDGDIFWLTRNCWVSRQNSICHPHKNTFEGWLHFNCEELKE